MLKIPLIVGLLACSHEPTIIKKAAALKKQKIVGQVKKTVDCAFNEAQVLAELTLQCRSMFEKELKKFKEKKCNGEKLEIDSKLYRSMTRDDLINF